MVDIFILYVTEAAKSVSLKKNHQITEIYTSNELPTVQEMLTIMLNK